MSPSSENFSDCPILNTFYFKKCCFFEKTLYLLSSFFLELKTKALKIVRPFIMGDAYRFYFKAVEVSLIHSIPHCHSLKSLGPK